MGEGREWGASGFQRVQLKAILVIPPLVERLREASPLMAQTVTNSATDAARNWEFFLVAIIR